VPADSDFDNLQKQNLIPVLTGLLLARASVLSENASIFCLNGWMSGAHRLPRVCGWQQDAEEY
jgi:hypothetical protein